MSKTGAQGYDPRAFKALTFHDATARFRAPISSAAWRRLPSASRS
jgi:hypothetical protein